MERRIRIYKDKELIKKLLEKLYHKIDFQVALHEAFMLQKSYIFSQYEINILSKYSFQYLFSVS